MHNHQHFHLYKLLWHRVPRRYLRHKSHSSHINHKCIYVYAHGLRGNEPLLHNLTYREANQEIREALNKGEYREAQQAKKKAQAEPEQSKLAPLEVRHRTYKEMLELLPLYEIHKENLLERGLTMEQIKERRYRSVPLYGLHKLAGSLLERGCELEGVPGFYQDDTGRWTMNFKAKNSGFLVPVESVDGNIQACQIRLDQPRDNNKYLWFSSAGYPGGTSSGSPVHVIGDPDAETVYLTEGEYVPERPACAGRTAAQEDETAGGNLRYG